MSQFGTRDWAVQGKNWVWMVDHYYNKNNNPAGERSFYMTSPLSILTLSTSPQTISSGGTLQINLAAKNLSTVAHEQIMLGANLYSSTTGYINDSSNDKKVVLSTAIILLAVSSPCPLRFPVVLMIFM
jgi:hypothetical protein